eukprot:Tamp_11013.p1 GENE.Tamp_11013~~Tamp_11013.p1  ORF type:complete len:549 (-),score=91.59 Tamp_11013:322-1893(-)
MGVPMQVGVVSAQSDATGARQKHALQESAAHDDWWAAGGLSTEVAGVQAEGEMLPAHWVVDYTSSGREFWRDTNTGLSSMNAPGTTRIYKYGKWGNWASEGAQSRAGDCGAAARGHPLPEVQAQGLCAAVTGSSAQGTWDVDDQGHFDVLWPEPELEAAAQPGGWLAGGGDEDTCTLVRRALDNAATIAEGLTQTLQGHTLPPAKEDEEAGPTLDAQGGGVGGEGQHTRTLLRHITTPNDPLSLPAPYLPSALQRGVGASVSSATETLLRVVAGSGGGGSDSKWQGEDRAEEPQCIQPVSAETANEFFEQPWGGESYYTPEMLVREDAHDLAAQGPEMGQVLDILFEDNLEIHDVCRAGMTGRGSWLLAQPGEGGGNLVGSGSKIMQLLDADPHNANARQCLFVDEHTCIGCYNCAMIARNSFLMEPEHGRARVYQQKGDTDEVLQEAIETCPVDCIHSVTFAELELLEAERQDDVINNKARLVGCEGYASYTADQKFGTPWLRLLQRRQKAGHKTDMYFGSY